MTFHTLNEIAKALNSKGAIEPCPRCNNRRFNVLGESQFPIKYKSTSLLGSYGQEWSEIPTVLVVCDNCGYLAHHAQKNLVAGAGALESALRGHNNG